MKRNKKHENRVRKMVVACSLSAIVLTASTYAWFIGMKTVNVAPFEVNIAAIDGLALSLNGKDWQDTVSINANNYADTQVVGTDHHNVWSKLIPMSSVGKINGTSSNLELYEKGSLTPTDGGYRLLASPVDNRTSFGKETRGYVAFDLFVKNLSGNTYYDVVDKLNEEAIYLTTESKVAVADAGAKANQTGIENSVRVAFAQIGRIDADKVTDDGSNVRKISCASGKIGDVSSLSICSREATIWEPNDTKHVTNAINWYTKSCLKRSGNSYSGACNTIVNNNSYTTYAINKEIKVGKVAPDGPEFPMVDVYDGTDYNGYNANVGPKNYLRAMDYFTDTEKGLYGVDRPEFLSLAPKSVTKIRVYIYLEGQDVDNYDFASLGKKISVSFGFTKERFTGEDIDYKDLTELPVDVRRNFIVDYTAANEDIKELTNGVTFENNKLTIPRGITSFTFKDKEVSKTGTATVESIEGSTFNKITKWTIN